MNDRHLSRRGVIAGITLLAAPVARAAPAPLSPADLALAQKGAAYLQGLTSARARFIQTDPRGVVSQGEFWLRRPGKLRFQYDPPSGLIVASDGRLVSVLNPRLRSFQNYPLRLTPLSVLLAREIRIGHGFVVSAVTTGPGGFSVAVGGGPRKYDGRITLDFSRAPISLTGWTITDPQGGETRVHLVGLHPASGFDPALFDLRRPPSWTPAVAG